MTTPEGKLTLPLPAPCCAHCGGEGCAWHAGSWKGSLAPATFYVGRECPALLRNAEWGKLENYLERLHFDDLEKLANKFSSLFHRTYPLISFGQNKESLRHSLRRELQGLAGEVFFLPPGAKVTHAVEKLADHQRRAAMAADRKKREEAAGISPAGTSATATKQAPKLLRPAFVLVEDDKKVDSPERGLREVKPGSVFHLKVETDGFMPGEGVQFQLFRKAEGEDEKIDSVFGQIGKTGSGQQAVARKDEAAVARFFLGERSQAGAFQPGNKFYFVAKSSQHGLEVKSPEVVLGEKKPDVHRVRLTGMFFDLDKCFLLPSAMRGIRAIKKEYDNRPANVLVVGHTDTSGAEAYNLALSLERAEAMVAYLTDDVGAWEAYFGDKPPKKRWGILEVQHMLSVLPEGEEPFLSADKVDGKDGPITQGAVKRFQKSGGLKEDGIAGPMTRKALITRYMGLDGTSLPAGAKLTTHGCGENFPAAQVKDGSRSPEDRRVEMFFFEGDIAPPPPGKTSKKGSKEYQEWVAQVTETVDVAGGGSDTPSGELPDYDPGEVAASTECGCGAEGIIPPAEDLGGGLSNVRWSVETALCGDDVKLLADSTLADGAEVAIRISTAAGKVEEAKAQIKGKALEFPWKVKHISFAYDAEKKPLPEIEIEAELQGGDGKASPEKKLKVKKIVETPPETFDKNYTWGQYGVHARFNQAVKGEWQKVIVRKKVLKTWGGTYVKLVKAGITGVGGNFPWAGHRWARCKKGEMFPHEYWDGTAWKKIPANAAIGGADFGTLPLIKKGAKVVWVSSDSAIWPDPVEDYKWEDYEAKRKTWADDCHKRWTRVWRVKRKACTSPKDKPCCAYEVWLEFAMDKVDSYANDVLCLAPGSLRSNAGLMFYGETRIAMAAHEVGHLVGLPDEYVSGAVDSAVNGDGAVNGIDGTTLMGGDLSEANNKIKKRHYSNFLTMARALHKKNGGKNEEWVVEDQP